MFELLSELFSDFFGWMAALPVVWMYATLFLIAYGENVVPPIPGDLVIVFGGYLAATGQLHLGWVVLLATVGGAMGFMTMYGFGRKFGDALLDPNRFRWLPKGRIVKVQAWIHRWGYGIVAANRFLSGARSVISLAVGMARMPTWNVLGYATFSAAVWTGGIAYLGYLVGDNWRVIGTYLQVYGRFIFWGLVVLALIWWARRWHLRKKSVNPS